jgi:GAF domain-containing protein
MGAASHIDPAALERSLSALGPGSPEQDGLLEALEQVLAATRQLFSASGAGLMMLDDSAMLCALASTDPLGRLLEERQEQIGHGPCVDAVALDRVITTSDLGCDERWPSLLPELPEAGVRAVLGVPIRASGVAVASLNVYRDQPHDWDASDITALTAYGTLIEGLLRTALHVREQAALAQQLQHALDNRVVIERAVGVIMGRERVGAVTAFNHLRNRARGTGRKVADVAADLLEEVARG